MSFDFLRSVVIMSTKYLKDNTLLPKKAKRDEHISGITGMVFSLFASASVLGAVIMSEKNLTKDAVPVDVDTVLFWVVWDAEKAALEVEDYRVAIALAAQTALREVIGQIDLVNILIGRATMDDELQKIIDDSTTLWGVTVQ